MIRRPPGSALFPYTTLFGSARTTVPTEDGEVPALVADPALGDLAGGAARAPGGSRAAEQRSESTRLNSSHANISYAVFCLKKKNTQQHHLHAELVLVYRHDG